MKNRTIVLLAATLTTSLFAGQIAIAGEETERDEYSIGITWLDADDTMETNKVNYSIPQKTEEEASAIHKELFPEYEGR